jgi:predicted small lipoprotein YifL
MKVLPIVLMTAAAAGCGQKGPLLLPDARTATPVVRPAPAADAPATPAPAAADKKKRTE